MKMFFNQFKKFLKYKSSDSKKNTSELKDIVYSYSESLHFWFGLYLIYKEFEKKNIKDIQFNNQNPEYDKELKRALIVFRILKKTGGFFNLDEFEEKVDEICFILDKNLDQYKSYEDIKKYSNYNERIINKQYLSVEDFQKIFYISSYYKNVNVEKMRSYWNKDKKEYSFFEFIDNLELDDKDLIYDLKSMKPKYKHAFFVNTCRLIRKSSKKHKKVIDEYFDQKEKIEKLQKN